MPRKVGANSKGAVGKSAAKKRVAAKGFKLPDPIESGQILTDLNKNQWILGHSIGQGGFGEIYLASDTINKPADDLAKFVVKVEPHSNGPLFTEMHCYMRIAKPEYIEAWMKERRLKRLGMPKFLGSGSLEYQGQKYRFMVMERFGSDLQKILLAHNKRLSFKTVCQAGIEILDVLEYIHSKEYIHADIKASNLLIGFQPGTENQLFLVDYGLACRYTNDGKHKEYKYDARKAHDGTIEFTSRDAHIGAHSRRGDLEILGYNLIQWLCGKLPWEDDLQDCNYVATQKRGFMDNVPSFMARCFPDGTPPGIQEYTEYVASLTFDEKPNYEKCRIILREGLKARGYRDDGKLVFMAATPKVGPTRSSKIPVRKKGVKRRSNEENLPRISPKKIQRVGIRCPFKPRNLNGSRINTRTFPRLSMEGVSLSKLRQIEYHLDPEELMIEIENQKMLERQKRLRPNKFSAKKDTSLDNPTPQMLELLAKRREKSISPPICQKRHRHNSVCQNSRVSPTKEDLPTDLTPAMEEVIRKIASRPSTDTESSMSPVPSPQMFDSDGCDSNNETVYYSPCGGSPHEHTHKARRPTVKTARPKPGRKKHRQKRASGSRELDELVKHPSIHPTERINYRSRSTRHTTSQQSSPEIF